MCQTGHLSEARPSVHQPDSVSKQSKGLHVGLKEGDLTFGPSERQESQQTLPTDNSARSADAVPPGPPTDPPPENRSQVPHPPPPVLDPTAAAMAAVMAKLDQMQKGNDEWRAKTLNELKDAARSRSASRAPSVPPILPGITEEEPQTPTKPETTTTVLPDVMAMDVFEEIAKLNILVRRHKGLQIMDERAGTNAMKFEGLMHQWLDEKQIECEREKIINVCKRFEIKYRDVTVKEPPATPAPPATPVTPKPPESWGEYAGNWWSSTPSDWDKWTPSGTYAEKQWPGDRLRAHFDYAANNHSLSDSVDIAKACGKIKDKCPAPTIPTATTRIS